MQSQIIPSDLTPWTLTLIGFQHHQNGRENNHVEPQKLNWGHRPLPLCSRIPPPPTAAAVSRQLKPVASPQPEAAGGAHGGARRQSCRPFLWLFFARPSRSSRLFTLVFPARESLAFGAFFLKVQVFQRLLASTATSPHASRRARACALSHPHYWSTMYTKRSCAHYIQQCGVWRAGRTHAASNSAVANASALHCL